MKHKKFTGDDLLAMVPGLSDKIDSALSRYGKSYPNNNDHISKKVRNTSLPKKK